MDSKTLTRAAEPLVLFDKQGEPHEYRAKPLTDKQIDELEGWIQSQVVTIARKSLREDPEINEAIYQLEISAAQKAALGVSLYESEGSQIVNTPAGRARLAWMMCKEEHPKLESDYFKKYVRSQENSDQIVRLYAQQNNEDVREEEGGEAKNAQAVSQ